MRQLLFLPRLATAQCAGLGLLLIGFLTAFRPAQAQCLLVPVPLAERVGQAALVVEAEVAETQASAVLVPGHIISLSTLRVFKVFQGQLPAAPLRVTTPGGRVADRLEVVSDAIDLAPGVQGVFMLVPDAQAPGSYKLFAGPQGLIRYDLAAGSAAEPFARYPRIAPDVYGALQQATEAEYRTLRTNPALASAPDNQPQARPTAVSISSFSPATVTAGSGTVLTINGSGFGAAQGSGKVEFRNANNGGSGYTEPLASDYVSWTDTQIQVRVFSNGSAGPAGTGTFRVTGADGTLAASPSALTVTYALSNAQSSGINYRVSLVSDNGSGGYTLQFAADFVANAAAQAAFRRAINTWTCQTGVNLRIGSSTTVTTAAADGVNVVAFDGASALPAGVLGRTSSYYSGCGSGSSLRWYLRETDYIYNSATNWQFGPANATGSQYDFESVALHEAGHGIQLTHIISSGAVMHYAISNASNRRTLNAGTDIAAGNEVMTYSRAAAVCSQGLATTLPCGTVLPVELVSFSAKAQPDGVRLRWQTASERNSAAFVVESAIDTSARSWQPVVQVAAAGNSSTARAYEALDPRLLSGLRYYRLRQHDHDGTTAFSPVVAVSGAVVAELQAYPNPAAAILNLRGPVAEGHAVRVRLLDASGRQVRAQVLPANQPATELVLSGLRAGLYLVEWSDGQTTHRTRIQKPE